MGSEGCQSIMGNEFKSPDHEFFSELAPVIFHCDPASAVESLPAQSSEEIPTQTALKRTFDVWLHLSFPGLTCLFWRRPHACLPTCTSISARHLVCLQRYYCWTPRGPMRHPAEAALVRLVWRVPTRCSQRLPGTW